MAFADKIRFRDSDEDRRVQDEFAQRFKSLSGFDYPPKNQAEWSIVLKRAGFAHHEINQFLNTAGFAGFEECGELPPGYVGAQHGDWPTFTVLLMEGLERWANERRRFAQPEGVQDDVYLALGDLMKAFGVPQGKSEALRGRLKRWMKKNPITSDYTEVDHDAKNQPKYLYRVGAVKSICQAVLAESASSETPNKRPTK